jgi:hypothetical protein
VGFPVVVLDGLGDSVEVPLLGLSIVSPSLEPDVVGTVALDHSVEWEFRDDVEWSVYMEAKIFVETLSLDSISLVKIDNIPNLSSGFVVAPNLNWVSFLIFTSSDIKDLAVGPIDELAIFVLENLEPA